MAYDRLEPIGYRRFDLLFAHLAYQFYQSVRTIGHKVDKTFTVEDFLPDWAREKDEEVQAEQGQEQLKAKAIATFKMMGARPREG